MAGNGDNLEASERLVKQAARGRRFGWLGILVILLAIGALGVAGYEVFNTINQNTRDRQQDEQLERKTPCAQLPPNVERCRDGFRSIARNDLLPDKFICYIAGRLEIPPPRGCTFSGEVKGSDGEPGQAAASGPGPGQGETGDGGGAAAEPSAPSGSPAGPSDAGGTGEGPSDGSSPPAGGSETPPAEGPPSPSSGLEIPLPGGGGISVGAGGEIGVDPGPLGDPACGVVDLC